MSRSNTPGGHGPHEQRHGGWDGWDNPARPASGQPGGWPPQPGQFGQPPAGYDPPHNLPERSPRQSMPQSPQSPRSPQSPPQYQPPTLSRQPLRRSRRGLWIALLVIVALLVAGGGAAVAYANAQAGAVAQAARQFCSALQAGDYASAYGSLSSSYQTQTSRDQFVADGKLHDQLDGRVTACAATNSASGPLGSVSQLGSSSITLDARIRRAIAYSGPLTLVKQGGDWKIANIAASLQGTNLAPLKTGQAFCAALIAGNYQAAYGLLSSSQQSQVSEQQFAAQFSDTFTGSPMRLAGCDLDLTTYFVHGTTSRVNSRLTISNPQASSGLLTIALTLVHQGSAWKINDLHLAD